MHEVTATYCLDVVLTIPDNEASTALTTLRRLGVSASALRRADVYRCEVERSEFAEFVAVFCSIESLFNPNKHALETRQSDRPGPGEVWIDQRMPDGPSLRGGGIHIAGRVLPGVQCFERFTGWRLTAGDGMPAAYPVLAAATETLLCNSRSKGRQRHDRTRTSAHSGPS